MSSDVCTDLEYIRRTFRMALDDDGAPYQETYRREMRAFMRKAIADHKKDCRACQAIAKKRIAGRIAGYKRGAGNGPKK